MELNKILLVCAALLPAIILGVYVYKKDRVEKEPLGLLLLLLALGALSCYPAAEMERGVGKLIVDLFRPYGNTVDGVLQLNTKTYHMYLLTKNFIGIALIEEFCKWAVLLLITRKNRNFNCVFDGLIYAIFVSLGFAALENVMYVLKYGWITAFARAILSVPGHMFFGVLMGYYYSFWRIHNLVRLKELEMISDEVIPANSKLASGAWQLVCSLLLPILAHGLYDYCCYVDKWMTDIVLVVLMTFLYSHCFDRIKKLSKEDTPNFRYTRAILKKKYPTIEF